ncbi:MAG: AI-2E family transporter [Microcystaceae cyanobacterium]
MKFGQWLGFISLLISLYILWQIRQLLLLIFTAIVFAMAFNRIVRRLEQYRIPRNIGILITLVLSSILTILVFQLVVPPFWEQFQKLIELLPQAWTQLRNLFLQLREQQLTNFAWLPPPPTNAELIRQFQPLGTLLFNNFFAIFSNSVWVVLQIAFIIILTLLMVINPQAYRQKALKLFPSFYRHRANNILTLSEVALGNWLQGIVINCLFIGTLSGIGLLILQVKLVLVHALLAGLLNFIPNIGPATSVVFPITVALLDAPWKIVAILIWYFIIQNIESYVLTPTVMAKQVSLLPAVTLMAQIFFARTFGLLGLLLALPLTVVAKTWIEEIVFKDILDRWQITRPFPSITDSNSPQDSMESIPFPSQINAEQNDDSLPN